MPIVEDNQKFKRKVLRDFLTQQEEIEGVLLDEILQFLDEFDTSGGNFTPNETANQVLTQLRELVRTILSDSGYDTSVDELVLSFDEIESNVIAIHKDINDIDVTPRMLSADKRNAVELTTDNLKRANIDVRFLQPVQKLLFAQVNLGGNVKETKKLLREMIVGTEDTDGVLTRWVGQVSRDAVYQFEGSIHATIKERFDLNAVRYVGTVQPNTRPQCRKWMEMGVIKDEDLQAEIDYAFKNGKGMIPGTTPANFPINRGGYNCAHATIPTRA